MAFELLELREIKPCPFCGGIARMLEIQDGEFDGGQCIECMKCHASTNICFPLKDSCREILLDAWNTRHPGEKE